MHREVRLCRDCKPTHSKKVWLTMLVAIADTPALWDSSLALSYTQLQQSIGVLGPDPNSDGIDPVGNRRLVTPGRKRGADGLNPAREGAVARSPAQGITTWAGGEDNK